MSDLQYAVRYPRRTAQRTTARLIGRVLLGLLSRTEVTGRENFPPGGPLLVVGNHVAAIETALMVVYAPWQIEVMGPGDIAPPPELDAIASFYGYTGINRGNVDRQALAKMLDILKQDGVIGLFPEGGIWDPGDKPAKRGVAWLSLQAEAPILPIGFGGLEGALNAMFRLQRPRLHMNVGRLIPPVTLTPGLPRKDCMLRAADRIMQAVYDLVPEETRSRHPEIRDERFELRVAVDDEPLGDTGIAHADALCKMFYRPAILRIFKKDLNLPVDALQHLDTERDSARIAVAIQPILDYLETDNPAFFTYRFGRSEGAAMEAGLRELQSLARRAAEAGHSLEVTPIRGYYIEGQTREIVEFSPSESHRW